MAQTNSPSAHNDPAPVVPLPYALYDSIGLVFELYQGGQASKHHQIKWVRLEPMQADRDEDRQIVRRSSNEPIASRGETSLWRQPTIFRYCLHRTGNLVCTC